MIISETIIKPVITQSFYFKMYIVGCFVFVNGEMSGKFEKFFS